MTSAAVIAVPVATVWSSPDAPGPAGRLALGPQPDVPSWTASLDHERRLGLVGRVVTQALWGDRVLVLAERDGWAQVVLPEQPSGQDPVGYPGWIPSVQLCAGKEISDTEYDLVIGTRTARGTVAGPERPVQVSFATRVYLPDSPADSPPGDYQTWAFTRSGHRLRLPTAALAPARGPSGGGPPGGSPGGDSPGGGSPGRGLSGGGLSGGGLSGGGAVIAESALGFAGLPYLWGGATGFGLDCSGLAWIVHRRHGIVVPRDADDQAEAGQPVSLDALLRGDLVFFAERPGGHIHHVGIALGDGRMVHSPRTGRTVEVTPLTAEPYASELATARRYH